MNKSAREIGMRERESVRMCEREYVCVSEERGSRGREKWRHEMDSARNCLDSLPSIPWNLYFRTRDAIKQLGARLIK